MELTGYSDNLWQCLSCMCVCVDWQASTQTVPDGRWVLHRCCTGNDADQTGTALCGTDSGPAQAECMFLMQCFTRWTSYLCKRRKLSDYIRFSVVLCVSRICEKSSGWFHEIWLRALPWCMEQSHFGVVLQKLVVLSYFVCVSTSRAETTEDVWMMLVSFLGHRLGDDLVDWNSGVSVRPSVRPYVRPSVHPYVHKKFFRFPSNLVCG